MIRYVGADIGDGYGPFFLIRVFLRSLQGDLRLMLAYPRPITYVHPESHIALCNYALSVRREKYLVPFQTLLGYWHSFHVPFTILMYIGAAIHIGVTLTFTS